MAAMTTFERMTRMYEHREADRVPVTDGPWGSTIERWHREGLPKDVSYVDYFELDNFAGIGVDNSPQYPSQVIEETEEYVITTTDWGARSRTGDIPAGCRSSSISRSKTPIHGPRPRPECSPTATASTGIT